MKENQFHALDVVEKIFQHSEESQMKESFFTEIKEEIQYFSEFCKISPIQAILLANAIIISYDYSRVDQIFMHMGLPKHSIMRYDQEIKELFKRKLLTKNGRDLHLTPNNFYIHDELVESVTNNVPVKKKKTGHLNFIEFLDEFKKFKDEYHNSRRRNVEAFKEDFQQLLKENEHLAIVKKMKLHKLKTFDKFLLLQAIWDAIVVGENDFNTNISQVIREYDNSLMMQIRLTNNIISAKYPLTKLNFIELNNTDFKNNTTAKLGKEMINFLKENEDITIDEISSNNKSLILHESIGTKELFYNKGEENQLATIAHLLEEEQFQNLQNKFKDKNMSIGLNVLLFGVPGTGKTESIYQFAKQTKRNIFKVDISETKSMWFGESQKLVKRIFTDYRKIKEKEENCPILMLNEADGIIGKRKPAGSSNVADTENAIQNILLEELENFDGILFATTNLHKNLDSAFERRFLFKVKFDSPNDENAAKIWKSKLPFLTKKQALEIAQEFQFSGGEIENIARKCEIEKLIFDQKITFKKVKEFCSNEKWDNKFIQKAIGFTR